MQRRLGRATVRDDPIHEVGVLRSPLECLTCAHTPAHDSASIVIPQVFCHECMLSADVVVEGHIWKWFEVRPVAWRC